MIDNALNSVFAEIMSLAICVDGVWYIPAQQGFATLFSCTVCVGVLFASVVAIGNLIGSLLGDLFHDLFFVRKKRKDLKEV